MVKYVKMKIIEKVTIDYSSVEIQVRIRIQVLGSEFKIFLKFRSLPDGSTTT